MKIKKKKQNFILLYLKFKKDIFRKKLKELIPDLEQSLFDKVH